MHAEKQKHDFEPKIIAFVCTWCTYAGADLAGTSRIRRGNQVVWEKPFQTGEANMSHTIANLEYHHFKYDGFRRPGDLHIHYFGTATLSIADLAGRINLSQTPSRKRNQKLEANALKIVASNQGYQVKGDVKINGQAAARNSDVAETCNDPADQGNRVVQPTCASISRMNLPIVADQERIRIEIFVRDNLPRAYDFQWIAKFGGMLDRSGRTHVPSGKFNAGEKALFWILVVVLCVTLSVTGYILNFPNFNQTRETMQLANIVHIVAAYLAIALASPHT